MARVASCLTHMEKRRYRLLPAEDRAQSLPAPVPEPSTWSAMRASVTPETPPISCSARNASMVRIEQLGGHWLRSNENGLPRLQTVGLAATMSPTLGRA